MTIRQEARRCVLEFFARHNRDPRRFPMSDRIAEQERELDKRAQAMRTARAIVDAMLERGWEQQLNDADRDFLRGCRVAI